MAKKKRSAPKLPKKEVVIDANLVSAEEAADILRKELPRLINDVSILVKKPFRFIFDPLVKTGSTDCLGEIRVAPRPFIEGEREVGYGTVYHECGHILFSPYGGRLLAAAKREDGEVLQAIVNIIVDRKDDFLLALEAPGFASTLRSRLLVLRTLAHREKYADRFKGISLRTQSQILRNYKPADPYEDFFLAAKCGKAPRLKATARAMKHVQFSTLVGATPEKLLWTAQRVREILRLGIDPEQRQHEETEAHQESSGSAHEQPAATSSKQQRVEVNFVSLWNAAKRAIPGKNLEKETIDALKKVIEQYLSGVRSRGIDGVLKKLSSVEITHPGPISVGIERLMPVRRVPPNAKYIAEYKKIFEEVRGYIEPMVQALRNISTPSEYELFGRDEGELDLSEVARIAANLGGYYTETVVERDIDAEIHLAIDCSGSMRGIKLHRAKGIGVVFAEAMNVMEPLCQGRIWSFNSEAICDYGKPSQSSGFVALESDGSNSDTHMLSIVGAEILRSSKRRKVLFVLCDDGPDSISMARSLSEQLSARGVIVIHLLIGVHGTPDIYPYELLYSSMKECLREFGTLLHTVIGHLK